MPLKEKPGLVGRLPVNPGERGADSFFTGSARLIGRIGVGLGRSVAGNEGEVAAGPIDEGAGDATGGGAAAGGGAGIDGRVSDVSTGAGGVAGGGAASDAGRVASGPAFKGTIGGFDGAPTSNSAFGSCTGIFAADTFFGTG